MRSPHFALIFLIACGSDRTKSSEAPQSEVKPQRAAAVPTVTEPHLRQLLAGVASAQACERIRNTYLGLESSEKPGRVTGSLWIRQCSITNDETTVRFAFEGDGWQWVSRTSESAGAEFEVEQYARFHVAATLVGTVDLAYSPESHVATVWFRAKNDPTIKFESTGDIDVDEKGTWSSIVGTVAGVVSDSPEERAADKVDTEGTTSFEQQLDKGMTITINACTGATRTALGILPAGEMAPAAPGESLKADVVLRKGGVLIFGPHELRETDSLTFEGYGGAVDVMVACMDDAAKLASAYHAGKPLPAIETLARAEIQGKEQVDVKSARCPVAVIASTEAADAGMSFVPRPPKRTPLIDCSKD